MSNIIKAEISPERFLKFDQFLIEYPHLSGFTKWVYSYIASRPPGWELYAEEIANHCTEGIDRVKKALKELQDVGLLKITRKRDQGKGTWLGRVWHIFEKSAMKINGDRVFGRKWKIQETDKPSDGKPALIRSSDPRSTLNKINKQGAAAFSAEADLKDSAHTLLDDSQAIGNHSQMETGNMVIGFDPVRSDLPPALVDKLKAIDVSFESAQKLVSDHGLEAVHRQLEWLPYREVKKTKASCLVHAIQNNYPMPKELDGVKLKPVADPETKNKVQAFIEQLAQGVSKLISPKHGEVDLVKVDSRFVHVLIDRDQFSVPIESAMNWAIV